MSELRISARDEAEFTSIKTAIEKVDSTLNFFGRFETIEREK